MTTQQTSRAVLEPLVLQLTDPREEFLGRVPGKQIASLFALCDDTGRVRIDLAMKAVCPEKDRKQGLTHLRNLRMFFSTAARDAGLKVDLVTDTQTRSEPANRHLRFIHEVPRTTAKYIKANRRAATVAIEPIAPPLFRLIAEGVAGWEIVQVGEIILKKGLVVSWRVLIRLAQQMLDLGGTLDDTPVSTKRVLIIASSHEVVQAIIRDVPPDTFKNNPAHMEPGVHCTFHR